MAQSTQNTVNAHSIAYTRMAEKWRLIEDLCGGTRAMREAGETWLPKETREKHQDYRVRLERSILYAALSDTIDKTTARPFAKAVSLRESDMLPEALRDIEDNADLSGSSLTAFAREVFTDGLKYGKAHVLVDYPPLGRTLRLSEERAGRVRPYFCRIAPPDLIGWRSSRTVSGDEVLDQVRIRETTVEADGEYGEREVERVRVYTPEGWELREKGSSNEWAVVESGTQTLGEVPLVTIYFSRDGYMEASPCFEDLAWLNLAHWQSNSDQRNLLRVARVPIITAKGVTQDEIDKGLVFGPSNLLWSKQPDAEFAFLEHSGRALGAGEADLRSLEERMEVLGLQPLISRSGGVTATAKSMDEARSESNIQTWIRATESGLLDAYRIAAKWINVDLGDDFGVDIYSDFGLTLHSKDDVDSLMGLYGQGVITSETLLYEIKRRGIVSETVNVEEETQAARDAVPSGFPPESEPEGLGDDVETDAA